MSGLLERLIGGGYVGVFFKETAWDVEVLCRAFFQTGLRG